MSKYGPLGHYLGRQKQSRVPMTFTEIEKVIGFPLPNSQRYPAWWSNNAFNNVMTQVWLDAGFATEQVDVVGRRLVFRRTRSLSRAGETTSGLNKGVSFDHSAVPHSIVGCMRGTLQIAPGVDLTMPADPEWAEIASR